MSNIHAHARAREAGQAWLERERPMSVAALPKRRLDDQLEAFEAGVIWAEGRCAEIHGAEQEQWAEERQIGQRQLDDATALMRETAELLRGYEAHHLAKVERLVASGGRDPDTEAAVDDTRSKARRNALAASRLEAWLRGDSIYPITADGAYGAHAGFRSVPNAVVIHRQAAGQTAEALATNPAEVLRDIAEGMVDGETIKGVDHASFDAAAEELARPVPWRREGVADLVAVRLNTGDPRFDPALPATINGYLYVPAKENEHG